MLKEISCIKFHSWNDYIYIHISLDSYLHTYADLQLYEDKSKWK